MATFCVSLTSDFNGRFRTSIQQYVKRMRCFSTKELGPDKHPIFKPKKALILNKMTRYEYESKICESKGLKTEEELKDYLNMKQSDYNGLLKRHRVHYLALENITSQLVLAGIETRVVNRWQFHTEAINWADVIFSAGGDGTFLLAASKIMDKSKPVIGINTDPERSEGFLCLPKKKYSAVHFGDALKRLLSSDFRWKWRQRIRITMDGQHDNEDPIGLHDQQLKFPEYRFTEHIVEDEECRYPVSVSQNGGGGRLLPVRALNEVFIGESLSSRVSYYEIQCDDGAKSKQKSSGVTICTGTGSSSWFFHINHLHKQGIRKILKIGSQFTEEKCAVPDEETLEQITLSYNNSLRFDPSEPFMAYTIRDPIINAVYRAEKPRDFARRIWIRSRMWDSSLVIDGELSYRFNDGAVATFEIKDEDALRTLHQTDQIPHLYWQHNVLNLADIFINILYHMPRNQSLSSDFNYIWQQHCSIMERISSEPLKTQVAGRHGNKENEVLDIGDGYILKPAQSRERGTREINFYQTVFNKDNEAEDLLTLRSFIPVFYDSLIQDDVTYMKLENITWKMKQACVMDIKIGAITWDPDAPTDKVEREMKKFPPSQEIGFRLAGFMLFNEETNSTEHYAQSYCFHFTKESLLHQGFGKFFHPVTAKQDVIKNTLSKLYSIEKWFLNQKRFQFISSSILLVYDNHIDSGTESHRKCDVRMIDFTHVHPTDSTDTNYIHGLQMLIKYLTQLVQP